MSSARQSGQSVGPQEPANRLTVYLAILWGRRWLVVLSVVQTIASAWVFTLIQTPLYRSTATILIEPEAPKFVDIQEVTPDTKNLWTGLDANNVRIVEAAMPPPLPATPRALGFPIIGFGPISKVKRSA
jgi:uncharacterized protein involved in exopolysaccharide biosynthesis